MIELKDNMVKRLKRLKQQQGTRREDTDVTEHHKAASKQANTKGNMLRPQQTQKVTNPKKAKSTRRWNQMKIQPDDIGTR